MLGIVLNGCNQIGDQIETTFQHDIDSGKSIFYLISLSHQ